jgi:hypothetical protein
MVTFLEKNEKHPAQIALESLTTKAHSAQIFLQLHGCLHTHASFVFIFLIIEIAIWLSLFQFCYLKVWQVRYISV